MAVHGEGLGEASVDLVCVESDVSHNVPAS